MDAYQDIIQGTFIDSYHNITTRDLLGFKYITEFCHQSKYVVRIDDDVMLNIHLISKYLANFKNADREKVDMICPYEFRSYSKVLRSGKYGVAID